MATCPHYTCKIHRRSSEIAAGCIDCDIDNLAGKYLPLCVRCNTLTKAWKCAPRLAGCGRGGTCCCCCCNIKCIVTSCSSRLLEKQEDEKLRCQEKKIDNQLFFPIKEK